MRDVNGGASISVATVVLAVVAAVAIVAVLIRERDVGEGTTLIVAEGDIDVGGESTGEGEDHVHHDRRCAYSYDRLRSQDLAS